jgi:hypothetical protein
MRDDHRRLRRGVIVATIVMLAIRSHFAGSAERCGEGGFLLGARRRCRRDERTALAFIQGAFQLLSAALRRRSGGAGTQQFLRVLFAAFVAAAQFVAQPLGLFTRCAYQMLQLVNATILVSLRLRTVIESLFQPSRLGAALVKSVASLIGVVMRGVRPLFQFFALAFEPLIAVRHFLDLGL